MSFKVGPRVRTLGCYSKTDSTPGSYPERPKSREYLTKSKERPVFIGGNEGLAVVEEVAPDSDTELKEGDWGAMQAYVATMFR